MGADHTEVEPPRGDGLPSNVNKDEPVPNDIGIPLKNLSYGSYMSSDAWAKLRSEAIKRDEGKCLQCGTRSELNVHHHTYPGTPAQGNWDLDCLDNLTTLCKSCHDEEHDRLKAAEAAIKRETHKLEREWSEKKQLRDALMYMAIAVSLFLFAFWLR